MVVCYYFLVLILKKNKEVMVRSKYLHSSLIFWAFFVILAYGSFFLMSHFINVEYNCKPIVKSEAKQKIALVDSLRKLYKKRANNDIQGLRTELNNRLMDYKYSPTILKRNELSTKPFYISSAVLNSTFDVANLVSANVNPWYLKINNNINNIDSTIKYNNNVQSSVFEGWKRLSIVGSYNQLNEYVQENINFVNQKLGDLPINSDSLNITFNRNQLPLNSPIALNKLYPPNISIPIIVIITIHLFILIPFFTEKIRTPSRSTQPTPLEIDNVRYIN